VCGELFDQHTLAEIKSKIIWNNSTIIVEFKREAS